MRTWVPFTLACALGTFAVPGANALTPNVAQLVQWETGANGADTRSAAPIALEHFEIPLEAVAAEFGSDLEPAVRSALLFEKKGVPHVRWILNPEDTEHAPFLRRFLERKGLDSTRYHRFTAYFTASRSLIIEDPETGAEFSAKVGTNQTGGLWTNKQLTANQAVQSSLSTREIQTLQRRIQFQHGLYLEEPLTFAIAETNQGFVVRSLKTFHVHPERYYMPAFSTVHEEVGRVIALRNGSRDPAAFWRENAVKPIARTQAEFVAFTGRIPESGHWQNYLIELDSDFRPTGRVGVRDFSDSDLLLPTHLERFDRSLLEWWPKNHVKADINLRNGPLHGNVPPNWLKRNSDAYEAWHATFYQTFEMEFGRITGIPPDEITAYDRLGVTDRARNYFGLSDGPNWARYFRYIECYRGSARTVRGERCPPDVAERIRPYLRGTCPLLFTRAGL